MKATTKRTTHPHINYHHSRTHFSPLVLLFIISVIGISGIASLDFDSFSRPTLSLTPVYSVAKKELGNWQLMGDAFSMGDRIRISGVEPKASGLLTNIKEHLSYSHFLEVSLEFSVHTEVIKGIRGPGLALWLTSTPITETGDLLGSSTNWKGLSIYYDSSSAVTKVSVYVNDGSDKFSDFKSRTPLQSCEYPFRKINSDSKTYSYLLIEENRLFLFLSEDKKNWEDCIIGTEITRDNIFLAVSAANIPKSKDFHDVYSMYAQSSDVFKVDEESFRRPSLHHLAPLITKLDNVANDWIDLDDEDVAEEISELTQWFKLQLNTLKLICTSEVIDVSLALDKFQHHIRSLQESAKVVEQYTANVDENIFAIQSMIDGTFAGSPDPDLAINSLATNMKHLDLSASQIYSDTLVIAQLSHRRKSQMIRDRNYRQAFVYKVTNYLIIAIIVIVVLFGVALLIRKMLSSRQTKGKPSWAM